MTKKKSSEIFTLKMDIFSEIGPRKIFLVSPKFGARSPPMPVSNEKACRTAVSGLVYLVFACMQIHLYMCIYDVRE